MKRGLFTPKRQTAQFPVNSRVRVNAGAVPVGAPTSGTVEIYSPAETRQYYVRLDDGRLLHLPAESLYLPE